MEIPLLHMDYLSANEKDTFSQLYKSLVEHINAIPQEDSRLLGSALRNHTGLAPPF